MPCITSAFQEKLNVGEEVDGTRTLTSSSSSEDLNPECQLAVSNLTVAPQYATSACSVCEVKVRAEAELCAYEANVYERAVAFWP